MKIDDTTILRFVDGTLSEQELSEFEQALETDEALVQKVEQMQSSDLPFKAAFSQESLPPMPSSLIQTLEQAKESPELVDSKPNRGLFSVKVASLCAVFFIAGFFINGGSKPSEQPSAQATPLVDAMIQYQALYTRDTVAPVNQSEQDAKALIDEFNQRYGSEVSIPNFEAEGYRFRRVQQLAFEGQPILQMVYMGGTGEPIALCLTLSKQNQDTPQRYQFAGLNSYLWEQEGVGYMLMAKLPLPELEQLLNSIKAV